MGEVCWQGVRFEVLNEKSLPPGVGENETLRDDTPRQIHEIVYGE